MLYSEDTRHNEVIFHKSKTYLYSSPFFKKHYAILEGQGVLALYLLPLSFKGQKNLLHRYAKSEA